MFSVIPRDKTEGWYWPPVPEFAEDFERVEPVTVENGGLMDAVIERRDEYTVGRGLRVKSLTRLETRDRARKIGGMMRSAWPWIQVESEHQTRYWRKCAAEQQGG